ncbi:MAG TPA: N-acetylgalactosamine-6-sulfatase, partial [Runella sp.]|nr:N-acetylgalactosamine-6-sulfatase [Runella sp.]
MKRIVLLLFLCWGTMALAQKSTSKPNVIYIFADDLGYGEVGVYGQKKIKTPNLDRLAEGGMRFTQHYSSAPVCAPSRCGLMTGRHTGHTYIRGNYELGGFEDDKEGGQMPLNEGAFTIGHLFQKSGYKTGAVGKWGMGMANTTGNPNQQGFDFFYGLLCQKQSHNFYPTHLWKNGEKVALNNPYIKVHRPMPEGDENYEYYVGKDYAIDKMTEEATGFINDNKSRPFFLYLPYTLPHLSLQAPAEAVKEYIGKFDEKPYRGQTGYASTRYPYSTYAAMISYLDKQVGQIWELVKKLGIEDNTIIMFSSDNGATFVKHVDAAFFESAGPFRGLKMDVYEGGIRVPMIAYWKGEIKPGQVTDHVSTQYDVLATCADLLGTKPTLPTDGVSFLPTLLGKSTQVQHPYLYFEYPENGGQLAIRKGDWKGVKRNVKANRNGEWEIYNLKADIGERTNVAATHPELAKEFDEIVQR